MPIVDAARCLLQAAAACAATPRNVVLIIPWPHARCEHRVVLAQAMKSGISTCRKNGTLIFRKPRAEPRPSARRARTAKSIHLTRRPRRPEPRRVPETSSAISVVHVPGRGAGSPGSVGALGLLAPGGVSRFGWGSWALGPENFGTLGPGGGIGSGRAKTAKVWISALT